VSDVPEIDVETLEDLLAEGATLIDVREPDEYTEVHVPKAVLVPLATVPDSLGTIPTDGPVYVICKSGARSGRAVQWLRGQGVDATNVAGGTDAWVRTGKPQATGDEPG
jgi:rhodanese-related sulfurtransferase